MVKVWFTVCGN